MRVGIIVGWVAYFCYRTQEPVGYLSDHIHLAVALPTN